MNQIDPAKLEPSKPLGWFSKMFRRYSAEQRKRRRNIDDCIRLIREKARDAETKGADSAALFRAIAELNQIRSHRPITVQDAAREKEICTRILRPDLIKEEDD